MTLALLLALAAAPQGGAPIPARLAAPAPFPADRAPSTARHAGIYHVATSTWTRRPTATAAFGPDVVYDNTAYSGYFASGVAGGGASSNLAVVDEGGLPGTTNLHPFPVAPHSDEYWIRSIEIGYCDRNAPGTSGWHLEFYASYQPCEFEPSYVPDGVVDVTGLPANDGCWIVQLDLSGGMEFAMAADGGPDHPGWDDDSLRDSFGWSHRYIGPGSMLAGMMLAGDPISTDPGFLPNSGFNAVATAGTETYFGPSSLCNGAGTGYLTRDIISLRPASGSFYAACNSYFYRNALPCTSTNGPFSSFHLQLTEDPSGVPPGTLVRSCSETVGLGSPYCVANLTTSGREGFLCMAGSASASDNDVQLYATRLPVGTFGFFLTSQTQGFVANAGGSRGNLCLGGDIGRFVGPGQVKSTSGLGRFSLDTRLGEWSVASIPFSTGNYAASTGTTTHFQAWFRDGNSSNFTNGYSVTWL